MKRLKFMVLVMLIGQSMVPQLTWASDANEALGACFVKSTTAQDRIDYAKWIYETMSLHPQLLELSSVNVEQRRNGNLFVAKLVTRLMTKDCVEVAKIVMSSSDGSLDRAMSALGIMAMKELMVDSGVRNGLDAYTHLINMEEFLEAYK